MSEPLQSGLEVNPQVDACANHSLHGEMPAAELCPPIAGGWRWVSGSGITGPSSMTVWDDPNPEVGRILGPQGHLLRIVRAKPERTAGFKAGGQ